MRHVTDAGLALIRRFESFSATIYVCPSGYATIGYGHVVTEGEREQFASGIDENEAEDLLRHDAAIAERAVLRLIAVPLTDGQFDALTSFAFNLGGGALQRSTLRRKVNREEHALVPAEFMKWIWASGRKLKGLVRRREAEARCYIESPAPGRASAARGRQ
jgi:GH24 family phage-related lysozyme (muramidase)